MEYLKNGDKVKIDFDNDKFGEHIHTTGIVGNVGTAIQKNIYGKSYYWVYVYMPNLLKTSVFSNRYLTRI